MTLEGSSCSARHIYPTHYPLLRQIPVSLFHQTFPVLRFPVTTRDFYHRIIEVDKGGNFSVLRRMDHTANWVIQAGQYVSLALHTWSPFRQVPISLFRQTLRLGYFTLQSSDHGLCGQLLITFLGFLLGSVVNACPLVPKENVVFVQKYLIRGRRCTLPLFESSVFWLAP